MNISSAGAPVSPKTIAPSEAKENPAVPDHDGDADDGAQVVAAKAPPAAGTGQAVDKTA